MAVCKCFSCTTIWVLSSFLAIFVLGGCATTPINYQDSAKQIVVQIRVEPKNAEEPRENGMGFIIAVVSENVYIMTANHVVENARKINITFNSSDGDKGIGEIVPPTDTENDLALLRVAKPRSLLKASEDYCFLTPDDKKHSELTFFTIAQGWQPRTLSGMGKEGTKLTFGNNDIKPGDSGSPVIIKNQIVGLVTKTGPIGVVGSNLINIFLGGIKPPVLANEIQKASLKDCETKSTGIIDTIKMVIPGRQAPPQAPTDPPLTLYKLTLATDGTGHGTVIGNGSYAFGANVKLIATPSQGSVFAGWNSSPCANSFPMPNDDLTCTARFDKKPTPLEPKLLPEMVRIEKCGLEVSQYEITFGEYEEFCRKNNKKCNTQKEKEPIINVSWNDATEYAKWLSHKEGKEYRLPTSQEWDCFAGAYKTGCEHTNIANCGNNRLKLVGQLKPNEFGLYDIIGNVAEWIDDCYEGGDYKKCETYGAAYVHEQENILKAIKPEFNKKEATKGMSFIGFRLVRSLSR